MAGKRSFLDFVLVCKKFVQPWFAPFPLHYSIMLPLDVGKYKVHPMTCHEASEGEQRFNLTLSLSSALDGGDWSTPRPGRFAPGKDPVPIVWETGFWTGAEYLVLTGI